MSVSVPLWGGGDGNLSKIFVNLCKEKYFCAFFDNIIMKEHFEKYTEL